MSLFVQHDVFGSNLLRLKEKQRIARNFSRAAKKYDASARLQNNVALHLMLYLPEKAGTIVDLGCGTGKWTHALSVKYQHAKVTGIDFSMGMLTEAKSRCYKNVQWCSGGIEALPFPNESFDLAFSNLAVQWCQLSNVLSDVGRVLKPGGYFVCATLAAGSLAEMRTLWLNIDQQPHANDYDTPEQQIKICNHSSLKVENAHHQQVTLYYTSVTELLREFKSVGINTVINASMTTGLTHPSKFQRFITAYEGLRQQKGIPCTYQVLYLVLAKK